MNDSKAPKKKRKRDTVGWLIRIQKHKIFVLIMMLVAVFATIGVVADSLLKVVALYHKASESEKGVTEILQRIEGQAATIDLVARKATEIETLVAKGSKSVAELEGLAEFTSTVSAAQNDNRKAFDQLEEWMRNPSYRFRDRAGQAWGTLLNQHSQPIVTVYTVPWNEGVDPARFSLARLIEYFGEAKVMEDKIALLQHIATRQDFPKLGRLAFFMDVMKREQSLNVVESAGLGFTAVAELKIKPLAVKYLEQWWEENRSKLK